MISEPIVTIVCCTYNHEKYIKDTLMSFINQKTKYNYVVLIHDDASTDRTQNIIKEITSQYPEKFVLVLQKDNMHQKGKSIERDIVAPMIKTKYVALCEGDDLWTDDTKLDRAISFLEAHDNYSSFGHNTTVLDCRTGKRYKYCKYRKDRDFTLQQTIDNVPHFSSLVLRTNYFIERPDFFNYLNAGDVSLKISLCIKEKMRYSHRLMSLYRKYSGPNAFSTNNIQTKEQKIANAKKAIVYLNYVKSFVNNNDIKYVELRILKKEFEIHYLESNYNELLEKKYREVFRHLPFKERLKIHYMRIKNG